MLKPKRLSGNSLARTKTVKWELERRFPARYTASNWPRLTSRASRGKSNDFFASGAASLLGRKAMTALLTPCGEDLAATRCLHARTKSVCLSAAALPRLIGTLWQSHSPRFVVVPAGIPAGFGII